MVDTVCRNLVFADMHSARELKSDAIKFVAQNSTQVIQTEGWAEMVKQHPGLVTEVVSAISTEQPRGVQLPGQSSSGESIVCGIFLLICSFSRKRAIYKT